MTHMNNNQKHSNRCIAHCTLNSPQPFRLIAEKQLHDPSVRVTKILDTARVLYGLIHARYILSAPGLSDMVSGPFVSLARPLTS